ncbi:hypothetical protein [Rhizobium halophytocola]|uniref:Uncharacterized protein n=1 Tax=Rhizobium halophytocola TaxID=735519 RepID=A0ABS4E649_9HYPH|nr:hypothetical protein [Rhizobium halophytocola]MBP1853425.1 hypothetical protein [Rhizobium halophytocola]
MVVPVSFVAACAGADDVFIISTIPDGLEEEADYTRIYFLSPNGQDLWSYRDWPGHQAVSICVRKATAERPRASCALSEKGWVRIANSLGDKFEQIPGVGLTDGRELGNVTCIREIGTTLFVCGDYGQVYRRDASGWTAIDEELVALGRSVQDLPLPDEATLTDDILRQFTQSMREAPNFIEIDGTSEDDVYVCGLGGNLFHFDGVSWSKIETGTDGVLTGIHCVSEDEVWVVGQYGAVLRGNVRSGFQSLGEFFPENYIWSVRVFQGKVYFGTTHGLYVFANGRPQLITSGKLNERSPIICLDSFSDDVLWIATNRHAFRYDGSSFEFFEHQDNTAF